MIAWLLLWDQDLTTNDCLSHLSEPASITIIIMATLQIQILSYVINDISFFSLLVLVFKN